MFEKHYTEVLYRESQPYQGVMEGLEAMRDAGFTLVCITNKAERFTVPLLKGMGMAGLFRICPVRRHPAGKETASPAAAACC